MLKSIFSHIPGFRTGVLWKKFMSIPLYLSLVFLSVVILTLGNNYTDIAKDNSVRLIQNFLLWLLLIVIPFVLLTNIGKVRSRIPFLMSPKYLLKSLGWILICIVLFIGYAIGDNRFKSLYSSEYIQQESAYHEERTRINAEQAALVTERKENKKQANLLKKQQAAELKAVEKEAETHQKQELAAQKAEEKAIRDAETQTERLAKEEDTAERELEKRATLDAEVQPTQDAEVMAQHEKQENDAVDSKASLDLLKKFEKSLKKRDSKSITDQYSTADESTKTTMVVKINEAYVDDIIKVKQFINNRNLKEMTKLQSRIDFINKLPEMKSTNAGIVAATLDDLLDAESQLQTFDKTYPRLAFGLIKDVNEVEYLKFYVSYNIKSGGTEIGGFTIQNEGYTDKYFISSFTWSELFGYSSTDNWEAILKPSKSGLNKITSADVYEMNLVRTESETLIDNRGFKKDYPVYNEVSQQDLDTYYETINLMNQRDNLNSKIEQSVARIIQHAKQ